MNYDVSISIGTTANLRDLDKANKAVQDLGRAIDKLPPQLLPGGVGGTGAGGPATPTYVGTPSTSGGMTWRLDGIEELTGAVTGLDGSLDRMDKSITITSQRLDRNSSWLSRSINAMASLPGKIQSWGSDTMQAWGQFNGPLQNVKNMISVGKQAWDLGWSLGESLNEAFGVKVKQMDAKVAAAIQTAQDKLARWQDNLEAARAKHREDAFLRQEAAGVKAVNDAYAARLRTIEAIDRKAMAGLEHQQKLLQIENEKNRSIIRQRQIRGEITDSQARDELAMIDAKDANERMDIERKQAEQAAATSQAKAEAAEERYRKLQALSQSGMARQAVEGLTPVQVLNQADATKKAEEDLAKWRNIKQRQKDALKEIQQAIKDQALAATMLPVIGAPIALARKQAEDQARQDYDAAVAVRALEAWKSAMEKDAQIKKNDKAIRDLERTAQDVSGLTGKMRDDKSKVLTLDDWIARQRKTTLDRTGEIAQQQPIGMLPEAAEVIKKALSEQGPAGIGISSGERKLLDTLKTKLANDPRRLEAGNEFQEVIDFIDTLLNKYSSAQSTQGKLSGDVARLKARLDRIESQGKLDPRR